MKTEAEIIRDLAELDRLRQRRVDLILHWEHRYRELEHENLTRWSHGLHADTARIAMMKAIFNRIVQLRYPNKKSKGTTFERGSLAVVRVVLGDADGTY